MPSWAGSIRLADLKTGASLPLLRNRTIAFSMGARGTSSFASRLSRTTDTIPLAELQVAKNRWNDFVARKAAVLHRE